MKFCGTKASEITEVFGKSVVSDFTRACITATFLGIALYNSIELVILCLITFKRYKGIYFWTLFLGSISIVPYSIGYLLFLFDIWCSYFAAGVESIGWTGMVTCQSLVLWSRLHLIVLNRWVLRISLGVIIFNAISIHSTGIVLEFISLSGRSMRGVIGFDIFERIQLIVLSLQEIALSTIYVWETIRLLKLRLRGHFKRTLVQLLAINLIMILMDGAIIGFQYAGLFGIHVTFKAVVYSIKLKFEYAVLGKLVEFSTMSSAGNGSGATDQQDFVDPSGHHAHQYAIEQQPSDHRESSTDAEGDELERDFPGILPSDTQLQAMGSLNIDQQRESNSARYTASGIEMEETSHGSGTPRKGVS